MANSKLALPSAMQSSPDLGSSSTATAIANTIGSTTTANPYTAVTYTNSYVDFGSGLQASGYYKDACGIVHVVVNAKSGTAASSIFTLPAGYRPVAHNLVCADVDSALGYVKFASDGTVTPLAGGNTAVFCVIQFPGVN